MKDFFGMFLCVVAFALGTSVFVAGIVACWRLFVLLETLLVPIVGSIWFIPITWFYVILIFGTAVLTLLVTVERITKSGRR